MARAASSGRRAGLVSALALLTLLAVFAMHGPSSDHTLAMPGHGHHAAMAGGHHAAHHVMAADAASSPRLTAPGGHHMAHADCVATMRGDTVDVLPADSTGTAAPRPDPSVGGVIAVMATRPPPKPPDLDRLCISRT